MNRESKYAALVERLADAMPDFWVSRDFLTAEQVHRWPAMLVWATFERGDVADLDATPTIWVLGAQVRLHIARRDKKEPFEPTIHAAIDAVDDALDARQGEANFGTADHTTLGNLVLEAKIKGDVQIFRHPDDTRAIVEIPVEMIATD